MPYAESGSKINRPSPEPYPPIAQLGLVSDRRVAAVISADGKVRWLCLPSFDGTSVFGCLLDDFRTRNMRAVLQLAGARPRNG
jgi:hypothetical protein